MIWCGVDLIIGGIVVVVVIVVDEVMMMIIIVIVVVIEKIRIMTYCPYTAMSRWVLCLSGAICSVNTP